MCISFLSDFDIRVLVGYLNQRRYADVYSVVCLNFWKKMFIFDGPNFTICISFVSDFDIWVGCRVNQIRYMLM